MCWSLKLTKIANLKKCIGTYIYLLTTIIMKFYHCAVAAASRQYNVGENCHKVSHVYKTCTLYIHLYIIYKRYTLSAGTLYLCTKKGSVVVAVTIFHCEKYAGNVTWDACKLPRRPHRTRRRVDA